MLIAIHNQTPPESSPGPLASPTVAPLTPAPTESPAATNEPALKLEAVQVKRSRRLPPEGDDRRYSWAKRPRCSHSPCDSTDLRVYATRSEDGILFQHVECRQCGGRCIVVSE